MIISKTNLMRLLDTHFHIQAIQPTRHNKFYALEELHLHVNSGFMSLVIHMKSNILSLLSEKPSSVFKRAVTKGEFSEADGAVLWNKI